MIKTLLALSGAVLMAVPCLHAQTAGRSFGPAAGGSRFSPSAARGNLTAARRPFYGDAARYRHGGGHGHGHYYYYGGIPYLYDPFFYGAGYYGGFGYGYGYGAPYGYGIDSVYEGRIADDRQEDRPPSPTASLPTAVQRQLAKRGYYKGSVDGKFGPASKSALTRFQRDNDLDETGRINEETLKALGFEDHR